MNNIQLTVFAAAPFAMGNIGQANNVNGQLVGTVETVCAVSNLAAATSLPSVTDGATATANFDIECNDADGIVITLTSTEGGLESDDIENFSDSDLLNLFGPGFLDGPEIDYTAELTLTGFAGSLVLDTSVNPFNDISVDAFAGLFGGTTGQIDFELLEDGPVAGGYSDTIQISIEAQ